MNWILTLTRNNLPLTQKAIASFRQQDIGNVEILVIDNGSTDNTPAWLASQPDLFRIMHVPGHSVAASWNEGLHWLFDRKWVQGKPIETGNHYVLVVNNDVELRPDTYRHLVSDGGEFVTAVGSQDPEKIWLQEVALTEYVSTSGPLVVHRDASSMRPVYSTPDPSKKRPHPDFSCYLIRKSVWDKVGPFDEEFKPAFFDDNDYHVRMHRAGVKAESLDLPFYHYGSATIKNADMQERKFIQVSAERNKQYFFKKWGVYAGTPEYYALFGHPSPEVHEA